MDVTGRRIVAPKPAATVVFALGRGVGHVCRLACVFCRSESGRSVQAVGTEFPSALHHLSDSCLCAGGIERPLAVADAAGAEAVGVAGDAGARYLAVTGVVACSGRAGCRQLGVGRAPGGGGLWCRCLALGALARLSRWPGLGDTGCPRVLFHGGCHVVAGSVNDIGAGHSVRQPGLAWTPIPGARAVPDSQGFTGHCGGETDLQSMVAELRCGWALVPLDLRRGHAVCWRCYLAGQKGGHSALAGSCHLASAGSVPGRGASLLAIQW